MGDRANVKITFSSSPHPIYFYTHSHGSDLPEIVGAAIQRRKRWDNDAYLARIIFSEMLKADGDGVLNSEYGFGISSRIGDNEHPVIHVNTKNKTVCYESEDGAPISQWSFADYTGQPFPDEEDEEWEL